MVLLWFYLLVPQFLSKLFNLDPGTDIRLISALVAFSMFEAAYYSEIIRAGISSIPTGQGQAALALGMSKAQVYRLIILPQALSAMMPLLLTQAIILFQDTSLVYILGLADFFRTATNIGKSTGYEIQMVLFAGTVYLVICIAASYMVKYFQKRITQ